ncbi:DUF3152 domain-containing protein [Streptomyces fagopyri]|uniref:DUF3152 domain-containing protein n=1 Tax=Streptomyces fagopyri TaxID=2662397 RepID=A0A5Q0LBY5_9ACTN|nr:DUF3152 domain-containing protein [Streptomyces fagopyri]QFZ74428.1 DUF3152 domain-containing protein [Streptomyces fagopyri]
MGRHSRRGRAEKSDTGEKPAAAPGAVPRAAQRPGGAPQETPRGALGPQPPRPRAGGTPASGAPGGTDGTPARGVPAFQDRFQDGTPAHGIPRPSGGTSAQGIPRFPDGTPAHGVPRFADGTPARGIPRTADGTPVRGVPRVADGTAARGPVRTRGGHPEQRETGGGWGEFRGGPPNGAAYGGPRVTPQAAPTGLSGPMAPGGPRVPGQRQEPGTGAGAGAGQGQGQRQGAATGFGSGSWSGRGPRQAYVDAFDEGGTGDGTGDADLFAPRQATALRGDPHGPVTDRDAPVADRDPRVAEEPAARPGEETRSKGGKGRTFTGIAAAAVTTVLAVVVAGQVATGRDGGGTRTQSAAGAGRGTLGSASRGDGRTAASGAPAAKPVKALTYDQKMGEKYALGAKLKASGRFAAVAGFDKAPGEGRKYTYRVDVEQGLGLDGALFAQAVQKTLNDRRSWAHGDSRAFERISSGRPDFVITLASPGTTAEWCAKSGLDTTEDNVSCDSASTDRVMINAYRWAQGSRTYGDAIHPYRQMLINHEVGHRLGYGHVSCQKDGALAPVMQQQTKFLDHDGIHCLPNPWPYPGS